MSNPVVENIAATLTAAARSRPWATAVACPAGADASGVTAYSLRTFAQLDRESDLLARGLAAAGVGRGVRAALLVRPGHEFFALTFALFKAGAVPVLIDPGIGLKNFGRCLADARPAAFVAVPAGQVARRVLGWARETVRVAVTVRPVGASRKGSISSGPARRVSSTAPVRDHRASGGPRPGKRTVDSWTLAEIRAAGLAGGSSRFEAAVPEAGETAAVLFTSGSTGPPKGVVYTHEIFAAQVAALRDLYGIEPGEVDLCTFPLFALFAPALGMTSVVPEMDASRPARADPAKLAAAVETFGVTNLFGSPALVRRLGDYGHAHGLRLPSLRRVISAGAPVPARVVERCAAMLAPGVQVFTPYGATEALPVCSVGSDEILRETRYATDRGAGVCVGRPAPGMRVEVVPVHPDPIAEWSETLPLSDGVVGEVVALGPVVTRGYFGRDDATRQAKIPTGAGDGPVWHRMGDLGYRDDSGRYWFCGRKAHRVVTAAGPLDTIPCEAVFNTHPDVARTALVGVGPAGSARPVLCIEPKVWPLGRGDRDRIAAELRAVGAGHDHTRAIDRFLFHRSFPVDVRHNAKIFREKLALWAARRAR